MQILDNLWPCGLLAVYSDAALRPLAYCLPVFCLLPSHGSLPVHVDHWDCAELIEERWADRDHLPVVLTADGVKLIEGGRSLAVALVKTALQTTVKKLQSQESDPEGIAGAGLLATACNAAIRHPPSVTTAQPCSANRRATSRAPS